MDPLEQAQRLEVRGRVKCAGRRMRRSVFQGRRPTSQEVLELMQFRAWQEGITHPNLSNPFHKDDIVESHLHSSFSEGQLRAARSGSAA